MSASSMYGPHGRSWLTQAMVAWGHVADRWLWAGLAVVAARPVAGFWVEPDMPDGLWVAHRAFALVMLGSLIAQGIHGRRLCPRDVLPWAVPGAAAQRRLWWLRLMHRPVVLWVLTGLTALILLPGLVPGWSLTEIHHGPLLGRVAATAMVAGGMGAGLLLMRANRIHGLLHPWCPWCGDGGGEDESVPEPTPDPAGSATR